MASITCVPGLPAVVGMFPAQVKLPMGVAVVEQRATDAGEDPVRYLTETGSPARKPAPLTATGPPPPPCSGSGTPRQARR